MYSDGEGNYGCITCDRHWKAGGIYPKWPIAFKFCRKWSFGRKHWIEGRAVDVDVYLYTTIIHLGFLRLILGERRSKG